MAIVTRRNKPCPNCGGVEYYEYKRKNGKNLYYCVFCQKKRLATYSKEAQMQIKENKAEKKMKELNPKYEDVRFKNG